VTRDLERRSAKSTLAKLDDALLVGFLIVAALVAWQVVSWVAGVVFFVVKLAIVAALVGMAYAWVRSRR
jgi:hypothetical protein